MRRSISRRASSLRPGSLPPNRGRRRYPARPILGVGAVIVRRNRVLLVERARSPLRGYWSLPGGVLETGERLEEGIRREVREETGLLIQPLRVVEIFERILRDGGGRAEYHYVLIDYLCRVTGGSLQPADDVSRAEWVKRGALGQYTITEGTLPVIEKVFREIARARDPRARATPRS